MEDISSAVAFFVCLGTDISAAVYRVTDCREILHDGTHMSRTCLLPFWGRYPQGSQNLTSARLSVRSFVCLLPACERYTLKTNELISMQIGINLSPGQGHERSTSGVRRSKVKVTGG